MKIARAAPILGAMVGVLLWAVASTVLRSTSEAFRFAITFFVFTFGPGAPVLWIARDASRPARAWLACGFGVAASAAVADLLARLGIVAAYPFVAAALAGAGLSSVALHRGGAEARATRIGWRGALVAVVALVTGAIAFAHRLSMTRGEITVFGDYDSVDLSYYAAITSELTHHVPPLAPFYSGHALNYSWYPQLLLAMVHRFGNVAILSIYFKLAWPAFLTLAAVCGYLFVAELAGPFAACLALLLILLGGDFSWIVAWFFTPDTYLWDWLLWPTNFLAPTMEVLHFSTWTPSLPVMFVALFALTRQLQRDDRRWGVVAAICCAALVEFKPFAFAILIGGLTAAMIVGRVGRPVQRHLAMTASLAVLFAVPFFVQIASLHAESRSLLKIDWFLLPRTMLDKLNLSRFVEGWPPIFAGLFATPLFFAGGFGPRWIGVPRILHAASARPAADPRMDAVGPDGDRPAPSSMERVLAWMVLAGIALPFVLVTDPYHDTIQFYQTALYLMWVFTSLAIIGLRGSRRAMAMVATVALAIPSSVHFLQDKWHDDPRHPMAGATRGEVSIAAFLRDLDRDRTVIMHDRPADPSLLVILSERRSALSWARYVTGSEERREDVDQFFASADGDPLRAIETLKKYGVTHVIVRGRDRVHPDVLAGLQQLVGTPEAILYEVK